MIKSTIRHKLKRVRKLQKAAEAIVVPLSHQPVDAAQGEQPCLSPAAHAKKSTIYRAKLRKAKKARKTAEHGELCFKYA
jgi:hypothetical protein